MMNLNFASLWPVEVVNFMFFHLISIIHTVGWETSINEGGRVDCTCSRFTSQIWQISLSYEISEIMTLSLHYILSCYVVYTTATSFCSVDLIFVLCHIQLASTRYVEEIPKIMWISCLALHTWWITIRVIINATEEYFTYICYSNACDMCYPAVTRYVVKGCSERP